MGDQDVKTFSRDSHKYAAYRPGYPVEVFEYMLSFLKNKKYAWDSATGTGQAAEHLSGYFEEVYATDINQQQIDQAIPARNIHYSVQDSISTNFQDNFFDLVCVAQAIHWFDFDLFYKEVNRVLKDDGIIAVLGYGQLAFGNPIDEIINEFYYKIIYEHWAPERKYIEDSYKTIPFPWKELPTRSFNYSVSWSLTQLMEYLKTWSAVKKYMEATGVDPVEKIKMKLTNAWGQVREQEVNFPILLRIGKKMF